MSYERQSQSRRQTYGASNNRSALGYWVPLAVTVTVAAVGLVTWIWSERKDSDDDDDDRRGPRGHSPPRDHHGGQGAHARGTDGGIVMEDASVLGRVSGALRRTPSPQQFFNEASRRVAAGMAATGAAVGGALSSIREEDKGHYEDHTRWSEEAAARANLSRTQSGHFDGARQLGSHTQPQVPLSGKRSGDKRKAVAIVISAERKHHGNHEEEVQYIQTHASILSHLPHHIDADSRVFILIFAPELEKHPLASKPNNGHAPPSLGSSYSNIGHDDVHTPGSTHDQPLSTIEPRPLPSPHSELFDALYREAQALVEKESTIMPFTTPSGYVPLLRHVAPEVVYVQETLAGRDGEAVTHIADWVGQVVLVVGDESGHGGLVDSEDERGGADRESHAKWWHHSSRIGLGKGIEVVEGLRVGEDWRRRVRGHD